MGASGFRTSPSPPQREAVVQAGGSRRVLCCAHRSQMGTGAKGPCPTIRFQSERLLGRTEGIIPQPHDACSDGQVPEGPCTTDVPRRSSAVTTPLSRRNDSDDAHQETLFQPNSHSRAPTSVLPHDKGRSWLSWGWQLRARAGGMRGGCATSRPLGSPRLSPTPRGGCCQPGGTGRQPLAAGTCCSASLNDELGSPGPPINSTVPARHAALPEECHSGGPGVFPPPAATAGPYGAHGRLEIWRGRVALGAGRRAHGCAGAGRQRGHVAHIELPARLLAPVREGSR